jgi:hypothetical protein
MPSAQDPALRPEDIPGLIDAPVRRSLMWMGITCELRDHPGIGCVVITTCELAPATAAVYKRQLEAETAFARPIADAVFAAAATVVDWSGTLRIAAAIPAMVYRAAEGDVLRRWEARIRDGRLMAR